MKGSPQSYPTNQRDNPEKQLNVIWITVITKETFEKDANSAAVMHDVRVLFFALQIIGVKERIISFIKTVLRS